MSEHTENSQWTAPHGAQTTEQPAEARTADAASGPAATQYINAAQPGPAAPDAATRPMPAAAQPAPATQFGPATQPFSAPPMAAPVPPVVHRTERPRRVWPAVVAASLASALLASAGTVGTLAATGHLGSERTAITPAMTTVQTSYTQTDVGKVAAAVGPSVVSIQVSARRGTALGSGVILDAKGHILTNNHVVSGAQDLSVSLSDGRVLAARTVGTDPTTDLAVIALEEPPADLQPATFGDSDAVSVGEGVVAIGNPLGLSSTVTSGIVSALDRPVTTQGEGPGSAVVTNAIQVDAAINPGNSGGPLFDMAGNVIGINSSIASMPSAGGSSGSIGLGFAIPSNLAQRVAQELIESGQVAHSFLGVSLQTGEATADGATRRGAEVMEVVAGSAAEKAGIRVGDVIVSIDGESVSGADSLTGYVREYAPNTDVVLSVVRDGSAHEVRVTLGAAR